MPVKWINDRKLTDTESFSKLLSLYRIRAIAAIVLVVSDRISGREVLSEYGNAETADASEQSLKLRKRQARALASAVTHRRDFGGRPLRPALTRGGSREKLLVTSRCTGSSRNWGKNVWMQTNCILKTADRIAMSQRPRSGRCSSSGRRSTSNQKVPDSNADRRRIASSELLLTDKQTSAFAKRKAAFKRNSDGSVCRNKSRRTSGERQMTRLVRRLRIAQRQFSAVIRPEDIEYTRFRD
ncbi:hypothetical protein EVAR_22917_1 [Eumeta japonica]|uniref:Uncharacterized protein n=1 Tax=Eumeta variegata TaxID=151549 RepID=A0A4C1UVJ0_EUMVA|nr:hypothetical protein EVAR_22917_1 [Eumeta japonica]